MPLTPWLLMGEYAGRTRRGTDAADIAAEFGRLRQPGGVIDTRRNLLRAKKEWYPGMLVLHRFVVAISRETLNQDDGEGAKIDPLVWDKGLRSKARKDWLQAH